MDLPWYRYHGTSKYRYLRYQQVPLHNIYTYHCIDMEKHALPVCNVSIHFRTN